MALIFYMKNKHTIENVSRVEIPTYDNKFRCWYIVGRYQTPSGVGINISDMFGGCGVQQLYGWGNEENSLEIEVCLEKLISNLHSGTSLLICQVGQNYYNTLFTKALDKFGFEITKEYINYQHSDNYTQRLYTLTIKK